MAEAIVTDWLADYSALEPSELHTFAAMHEDNQEIADALYTILNERLKYSELIHSICHQFYSFYRSDEEILKRFTLQFIPVLIYIYLSSVAMGDKKSCRSVETLLISIYNVEVSTEDGGQKIVSFRMPVLAQASIYHEEKSLHTTDLRRWEENSNRDVKWGPLPQVESINAQNRMKVMSGLLFAYNQQLCLMQKTALFHLCKIASQLANQGFSKPGHAHRSSYGSDPNSTIMPKPNPRIPVSSQFLLELVHAIYFAMFNDFGTIAIQTLDDIHNRACYEMFSDLIIVTNAIRNSLHANPSGQPSDGPMGLSVALTPATNTVTVSKSMITNASFRAKKLPDDLDMEFLASLPNQHQIVDRNEIIEMSFTSADDQTSSQKDLNKKIDMKNFRRWKNWGWKYSPGSKTSSIEEEPDSPKKSISSSINSSPNASPKHKKVPLKEDVLLSLATTVRRKKNSNVSKQNKDNRLSAGARLCQALDDSNEDSEDEMHALLGNGRPASIHVVQTAGDDIPIQGAKEDGGALMSITEETVDQATSVGNRNTAIRSSKEGLKPHKVLIAGFKKSKDKEKEKEPKPTSVKNGNIGDSKDAKQVTKRDKFASRGSVQLTTSGEIDTLEKASPLANIKSKIVEKIVESSSNIPSNTTTTTISDMVPLQNLTNGAFNEEITGSDSITNSCNASDSIDSSTDVSSNQRPSLALVDPHGHIQISQV